MDWFEAIRLAATVMLRRHGLLAACAALFVEEAGIPLPILPGDVLMLAAGVQARQGLFPLWVALLALEAVTVAGSTVLYFLSKRAGRGLLLRYGRFLHVTPERLAQAEAWVQRRGALAVIAGRLVPGLRVATALGCGVLNVPLHVFLPSMAVGAFLYILLYTLLGYFAGQAALGALERVHLPLEVIGSAVVLVVGGVWIRRARKHLSRPVPAASGKSESIEVARHRRVVGGLTAGAVATLLATLSLNVLVPVAGDVALLAPGTFIAAVAARAPAALAGRGQPVALVSGAVVFVLVGVLWGAAYGLWVARRLRQARLPDWVSGVVFALAPLATSAGLGAPLVRLAGLGSRATIALLAGTVAFHLAYGIVLGLSYPVFAARRGVLAAVRREAALRSL